MNNQTRQLSAREEEVLFLILKEYTTEEIAAILFVSRETVKSHRRNLYNKMQVRNVAGLVRKSMSLQNNKPKEIKIITP